ncbi:MAG TPA: hypothetical protein VIF40_12175 [Methylosinus sp.]|uniref:hypothetical protein n=1 Tax=Methylosinus sp. TaxID=427 RepID=UPI002F95598F
MSDYLDKVNSIPISADLLGEVLDMLRSLPAEERWASGSRSARLFELLDRRGLSETADIVAVAIDLRVTALLRLQSADALRGWTSPGGELGANLIHPDLLKAAAAEPLIDEADGEAGFDAASFRLRLLAGAEVYGRA